jgi:quercetin dioxygenase-like cupin family protein
MIAPMEIWNLESITVEPRKPQVLRSDDGATRIIVLALPEGEQMQEHQVREHALLLVVSGEVAMTTGGEERALRSGDLVSFEPAERRELTATSDARLAMLLSPWPAEGSPSHRTPTL